MAKLKLDRILVIDVEATCWEKTQPPDMVSEIIEIGICVLDSATGVREEKVSLLVRPIASTVSAFCTSLTTLTQEQVDQGISFAEACNILKVHYRAKERVWASYGDYDRQIFQKQCERENISYPFGLHHLDIKLLTPLLLGWRQPTGMAGALKWLGVPLEGTHHRGDDDAWNIAGIFAKLLLQGRNQF